MGIVLTKFIEDFESFINTITDQIEFQALVGYTPEESANELNSGKTITAMNIFLSVNGFDETHCQILYNATSPESEFVDIAFFHYGKLMVLDKFRKYIQTGCEIGYSIKLLKKGLNGTYAYPLYLTEIGSSNLYSPNKKNSIVLDTYDKAKTIIEESDIPKNLYDVYLIQLHDKPFKDREIKYWIEDV